MWASQCSIPIIAFNLICAHADSVLTSSDWQVKSKIDVFHGCILSGVKVIVTLVISGAY